MYSTDISDGNFYHSQLRVKIWSIFWFNAISSFINIKYYFSLSILFYILILLLLIGATFFGSTVSDHKDGSIYILLTSTIRIDENSIIFFSKVLS